MQCRDIMGSGLFEIHAENVAAKKTTYLGCRDLDASRDLYEILGLVRSSDVAHISTKRDLPLAIATRRVYRTH